MYECKFTRRINCTSVSYEVWILEQDLEGRYFWWIWNFLERLVGFSCLCDEWVKKSEEMIRSIQHRSQGRERGKETSNQESGKWQTGYKNWSHNGGNSTNISKTKTFWKLIRERENTNKNNNKKVTIKRKIVQITEIEVVLRIFWIIPMFLSNEIWHFWHVERNIVNAGRIRDDTNLNLRVYGERNTERRQWTIFRIEAIFWKRDDKIDYRPKCHVYQFLSLIHISEPTRPY